MQYLFVKNFTCLFFVLFSVVSEIYSRQIVVSRPLFFLLLLLLTKQHESEKEKGTQNADSRHSPRNQRAERNDQRDEYRRNQRKQNPQCFQDKRLR